MKGIRITSDIGVLKKVLLHRPGRELLNLTPDSLEELLFDDIPFLRIARQEHDAFAGVLRDNGAEVVYLEDLMAEVLEDNDELRQRFLSQFLREAGIDDEDMKGQLTEYLNSEFPDNHDFVLKTIEGVRISELRHDIDATSQEDGMALQPLPNLYFQRDPFAAVANGVTLHRMYYHTRNRESIYGEYLISYHPDFAGLVPRYYDRYEPYSLEGGDIQVLNEHTLAIGISQRTCMEAAEKVAANCFRDASCAIDTVLAFEIPKSRAFMHLDTVFTRIDHHCFIIHPAVLGPLKVYRITADGEGIRKEELNETMENILKEALHFAEVSILLCGAGDKVAAAREQWNDGPNTLCVSPGVVIAYERNEVTNNMLREHGIKVLEIPSAELSRGRGGPRCMSMPLIRAD